LTLDAPVEATRCATDTRSGSYSAPVLTARLRPHERSTPPVTFLQDLDASGPPIVWRVTLLPVRITYWRDSVFTPRRRAIWRRGSGRATRAGRRTWRLHGYVS